MLSVTAARITMATLSKRDSRQLIGVASPPRSLWGISRISSSHMSNDNNEEGQTFVKEHQTSYVLFSGFFHKISSSRSRALTGLINKDC